MLKTAMSEAYDQVRVKTACQLKHQSIRRYMAVRTKSEIMCASFFPRHHEENLRNSIDCGVAVKKLSDVTYRVQEVKNCRHRS